MSTFEVVVRWCATCEDDVMFEQPGCADDHGGDCPEWTCVGCGDAMFVGFSLSQRASGVSSQRPGSSGSISSVA